MDRETLEKQKIAELQSSIRFCLTQPESKSFMVFLLASTMALDAIPAGLESTPMIELATIHRVGNKILKLLMEVSPEATGRLLVDITKDEQNERELTRDK